MRIELAHHFLPHACSVFHLIRAQQEYRMLRSMCDENVKPWNIHRLGGPLLKFDGERVIFSSVLSLPLSDCCVALLEHSMVLVRLPLPLERSKCISVSSSVADAYKLGGGFRSCIMSYTHHSAG
ncbi:hypothetical protein Droror1_Dr00013715 [Drosera rotundifolia]